MDAYQWDYAYQSLCASSRKEIGRLKFEAVIRLAKDPVFHEVAIYDFISDSILRHGAEVKQGDSDGDRARIRVIPRGRDAQGVPIHIEVDLSFLKEEGEWRLDFIESVNAIQSALPPPAGDISRR